MGFAGLVSPEEGDRVMTAHDENRVTGTFPTLEQMATPAQQAAYPRAGFMGREMNTTLRAENDRLRKELKAALGHMLNARIDLETGARKATAIDTLAGGIKRAREALEDTK